MWPLRWLRPRHSSVPTMGWGAPRCGPEKLTASFFYYPKILFFILPGGLSNGWVVEPDTMRWKFQSVLIAVLDEKFRPVFDVYPSKCKCIDETRVHQDKEMITAYFFYLFSDSEERSMSDRLWFSLPTHDSTIRAILVGIDCCVYHSFLSSFLSFFQLSLLFSKAGLLYYSHALQMRYSFLLFICFFSFCFGIFFYFYIARDWPRDRCGPLVHIH